MRPVRVGRVIQQVLSETLTRGSVKDPRVSAADLVSITDVRVSWAM